MLRRRRSRSALLALLLAVMPGAAPAPASTGPDEIASLELPLPGEGGPPPARTVRLPADDRLRSASGEGWRARVDRRTGSILQAWGGGMRVASAVADRAEAERLARDFLTARADLLETRPEEMALRSVRHAGGKFAVWFRQEIGGLRLRGAEAFVLLTEGGKVAAFGSTFVPAPESVPAASLGEGEARTRAAGALGARLRADRPATAELVLVRAPVGELLAPVPAWRVVFESERPFGRWETFVDARDGTILGRRNLYDFIDVVGQVQVRPEVLGPCGALQTLPAKDLTVQVIGGNSATTTSSGSFTVPHTGALPVLVTTELKGPYVDVNRAFGTDASLVGPATPGIPISFLFDPSNSLPQERDAFHHTIVAHDYLRVVDSTLTAMDYPVVVTIDRLDGVCPGNAWFDGLGMNFCDKTSTFENTGRIETIIYHEYGHGLTDAIYRRAGTTLSDAGLDEGNSDIFANFISRSSILGKGRFLGDCTSYLRDSNNTLIYPDDLVGGSGHDDGRIIAGFHWDVWQSLLLSRPRAEADSVARTLWHLARDLGTPQDMPSQVLWCFLADDDDGNLGDGTPNFDHLCLGATNHGFACPEPSSQVVITHTVHPHVTDGSQPFDITGTFRSTTGTVIPSSVTLHYRVNGRAFAAVPMAPTGNPDEYTGQIPPQLPMAQIEYFLSADDDQEHSASSPETAPADLYAFDVAAIHDDLESGAGWTAGVPGDDATSGRWIRVDPVGTLAQPADDVSPLPADVSCFVTGQCGPGHGTCWAGCNLGCNDVDGGATTLISPVYDVTGAGTALLKYDRWFSNDVAANPGEDPWVVDVSNDGGATWTNVENTTVAETAWRTITVDVNALFGAPGRLQLRFTASDRLNPSLVEAAVDEVRVLAAFGPAVASEESAPAPSTRLELVQNRPNPGGPGTEIGYALPEPSRVRLTLYDVRGRVVRDLVTGDRPAGRHVVRWDGRDAAGERVAPGVYFYRLATPAGSLTRKMTVAP